MGESFRIWKEFNIGDTTKYRGVLYWAPVEGFDFGSLARDYYLRGSLSTQTIAESLLVFRVESFIGRGENRKPKIMVVRDSVLTGNLLLAYLSMLPQDAIWLKC